MKTTNIVSKNWGGPELTEAIPHSCVKIVQCTTSWYEDTKQSLPKLANFSAKIDEVVLKSHTEVQHKPQLK